MQKAIEELRATETELDDVQEQSRAAQDVVDRIEVRAPVRGIVVKLHQHTLWRRHCTRAPSSSSCFRSTTSSSSRPASTPARSGTSRRASDALVKLTALNQRVTPMIEGKVIYLSADAVGRPAARRVRQVRARSAVTSVLRGACPARRAGCASQVENFRPTPGMPADVFIKTGERTFFDYIMRPVLDSFSKAFREH